MRKFDYITCTVRDLRPNATRTENGRSTINSVTIDGRECKSSARFMVSLGARFSLGNSVYRWFDPEEVFIRVSERASNDRIRVCVETSIDSTGKSCDRLLGVSNPASVLVKHDDLIEMLINNGLNDNVVYGGRAAALAANRSHGRSWQPPVDAPIGASTADITYCDGIVRSLHTPRNNQDFTIAGDAFGSRFVIDTPIDGYGRPAIYLMLLRYICSNGSIGFAPAFRSELSLGRNEDSFEYPLTRAIESYNNEDGFNAIRQRYESAATSWASIAEVNKVYKSLVTIHNRGDVRRIVGNDGANTLDGSPILTGFRNLVGDLSRAYGLANLDALGVKRQRTLPAGCNMYEMLNYISEVSTHYAEPAGSRVLDALNGEILSAEFDLEGTVDKFGDWKDFLVLDKQAAESFAIASGGRDRV